MTSGAMADTCLGEGSILLSMSSLINFCLKKKKKPYHFLTVCQDPEKFM